MASTPGPGANPNASVRTATPTTRRLTKEEMAKAVDRLSRPHTPAREPEPLPRLKPPLRMSVQEVGDSAQRLCNGAVEHKTRSVEALEHRYLVDTRPKSVLSFEERDASIQRLYYGAVRSASAKHEELRRKLLHPQLPRVQDKEKVDHSVQSLFYGQREREEKRRNELHERYVANTGHRHGRIDAATVDALVSRLGAVAAK
jgi:hypothetical protein